MQMTKRERLMAVLNGENPDRIPASFWFHFEGDQVIGEACVQAHLDYYRATDIDFIKIMCDGIAYPILQVIDSPKDWYNLKPLPRDHSFFADTIHRCKRINEELNGECYTFYNVFSPFNIIRGRDVFTENALQGRSWDETVMAHLKEDEEAVRYALQVIGEDMAFLAEQVIVEGGCLGIYQSLQGAEKGRMTKEEYDRIVKPSDLLVIGAANKVSDYNILHLCSWAGDANHLSYWQDYPSRVKNWGVGIEGMSLREGLEFFPEGTVISGGLDNRRNHPLASGTEAEVKAAVRAVLAEMEGVPFILGADCTVPADTDWSHIKWVLETVRS